MKNLSLIILILLLATSFNSCKKLNPTTPDLKIFLADNPAMRVPSGYETILDMEDILTDDEEGEIAEELFRASNDHDFVGQFISLTTIAPYSDPAIFCKDIGNYYGLGHKQHDDGLIVLISESLRFVQIATGLGIDSLITDSECKIIIDSVMIPQFKRQQYGNGLLYGIQALRVAKYDNRYQVAQ